MGCGVVNPHLHRKRYMPLNSYSYSIYIKMLLFKSVRIFILLKSVIWGEVPPVRASRLSGRL